MPLDTLFEKLHSSPEPPEELLGMIRNRLNGAGDGQKVWIFKELGESYYNREILDSAEFYFYKGIVISVKNDLNYFSSFFYTRLGMIENTKANYQKALELLLKAKETVLKTDSYELESDILRSTGNIYWGMGNYEKALENYLYSLETASKHNLPRNIASATNNIGNVYQAIHDYRNAMDYFQKAYQLSLSNDFKWIAAISANNIGDLLKSQSNPDSAIYYFTLSYDILDDLDSKFYKGVILYNIAEIYLEMDSLDPARKYLNESLELAGQSEDKLGIVSCYLKLGESYLKENNPSQAIFYIQDGFNIANETGSITLMELAHSLKARYFRQTGQKDSAMQSMMKQLELRDSLSRQESGESIARLENRFQEEKNRLEIENLVNDKINSRRLFLVIVTAISIILIIIFISLFQARKKGRILIEKNKEIENQQALLKVRNDELLKSRDELKKINEAKDQFLTILSHDLKNPVSAIRGFVELMINQYDLISEEKKKIFLQEIFDSIEKISLLITNVLFWVRSQTRGIKNYPETFSLAGRIDTNLSLYKLIAKDKGIHMENHVSAGIELFADVNIFDTIIRNLLSNSLKFTGKGGSIDISAEPAGRQILLKIKDTGVGISKEKLDKLLDPSYHISTSGTKKEPGTGLGLGLVKDFILLMGGDFRINSTQGKGTEFLLYFPVPRKN